MKGLIWFSCIFMVALVQAYCKQNGIILGGIPTAILFMIAASVAKALCKRQDAKKQGKLSEAQTK